MPWNARPGNGNAVRSGAWSPRVLAVIAGYVREEADRLAVSDGAARELLERGLDAMAQFRLVDERYRGLPTTTVVDGAGEPRDGLVRYLRLAARATAALRGVERHLARPLLEELHGRLAHHLAEVGKRNPTDPRGRARRFTRIYDDLLAGDIVVLHAIRRLDGGSDAGRPGMAAQLAARRRELEASR